MQEKRARRRSMTMAFLVIVAMLATACGGSDSTEGGTAESAAAVADDNSTETTEPVDAGSDEPEPAPEEEPEPAADQASDEDAATEEPAADPWDELPAWSGLQWGEVRAKDFEPAMSFVVPEGIGKVCTIGALSGFDFIPGGVGADANRRVNVARMNVVRLEPATIDETVAAIAAESAAATDPLATTIGGASAVTFDATASGSVDSSTSVFNNGADAPCGITWGGEGWPYRFWVADVDGEIVTFGLFATDGQLDEYSTQLQPLLDSIVWRDFEG